jgi:hypothetical protein
LRQVLLHGSRGWLACRKRQLDHRGEYAATPTTSTTIGDLPMNPAALATALNGDLANALIASTPGGIEQQEAQGQRELVESSIIPKNIRGATREDLTALGFNFGADADDLFVTCELPVGWTKRATDHSMHSDLLDEQGRQRAGIFYNAAFYDRCAYMSMNRRYGVSTYNDGSSDQMRRVDITDGGTRIFKEFGEAKADDYAGRDALEEAATAALTEQFPEWRNPLAYW